MNQNRMPSRALREELSQLFSALSHPHRIQIIQILAQGERDVNTLSELLGCTQSRVSQQLALLRSRALVQVRRDGRHAYYRLSQPGISGLVEQATAALHELDGILDATSGADN